MFIFMDTLTKLQAITYVKLRSTNAEAVRTRKELEKEQFLIEKYSKFLQLTANPPPFSGLGTSRLNLAELKSFKSRLNTCLKL
jgi:hypothetical protein